jgi:hypothetical protein
LGYHNVTTEEKTSNIDPKHLLGRQNNAREVDENYNLPTDRADSEASNVSIGSVQINKTNLKNTILINSHV